MILKGFSCGMRLLNILSREAHVINESNCGELDGQVTINFYLLKNSCVNCILLCIFFSSFEFSSMIRAEKGFWSVQCTDDGEITSGKRML